MISYLATPGHFYTVRRLIDDWMPRLGDLFHIADYPDALETDLSAFGRTVIFSDIDRLTAKERTAAVSLADGLERTGRRVLNHPAKVLGRYELLRRLRDNGTNDFNAYRAYDPRLWWSARFPAFVRLEAGHSGSYSKLLTGRFALLRRLLGAVREYPLSDLLVIEFMDVSDPESGLFRKYSYLRIGDQFLPRHMLFSRAWEVKYADLYSAEFAAEERAFVNSDHHSAALRSIFDLAGIEYGRIDYSCRPSDDVLQIWEINTNPSLAPDRAKLPSERLALQTEMIGRVAAAFEAEAAASQTH